MFKIEPNNDIILTKGDTGRMRVRLVQYNRMYREIELGDTLTLTVRKTITDPEVILTVQNIDLASEENTSFLVFKPEATADLDAGRYVYDVQLNTADGDVYTVVDTSNFILIEGVTKP